MNFLYVRITLRMMPLLAMNSNLALCYPCTQSYLFLTW
jgi:hypothetical protein